jgi:cobalt-zinc-cadmium efflux system membrane fusion protein
MVNQIFLRIRACRQHLVVLLCLCGLVHHGIGVAAPPAANPPGPMLVRQSNRLFVPQDSPLRDRLAVAPVHEQASPHEIALPAVVEANPAATLNVLPPLTGKLVDLKVRLGDTVKRGQLLASVSSPDFAQAISDAQKAHDALDLAQRALVRARGVNQAGSNAAKDVEAAESSVVQQKAELERSEARLRSLGVGVVPRAGRPGLLDVMAPMRGTVTALSVSVGTNLNDATVAMMTIANIDQVWVTVNVPEDLVGVVVPGEDAVVTLAAYPGRTFSGKVGFVGTVLDADTRRAKARINFANPEGLLKPNMFATARVALPEAPQPVVPTSALIMNNDSVSVFVEVDPWTFVRRIVELGREDGGQVRIRHGLAAGERVVVRGGVLLND